jgi:hypothetical protein
MGEKYWGLSDRPLKPLRPEKELRIYAWERRIGCFPIAPKPLRPEKGLRIYAWERSIGCFPIAPKPLRLEKELRIYAWGEKYWGIFRSPPKTPSGINAYRMLID